MGAGVRGWARVMRNARLDALCGTVMARGRSVGERGHGKCSVRGAVAGARCRKAPKWRRPWKARYGEARRGGSRGSRAAGRRRSGGAVGDALREGAEQRGQREARCGKVPKRTGSRETRHGGQRSGGGVGDALREGAAAEEAVGGGMG